MIIFVLICVLLYLFFMVVEGNFKNKDLDKRMSLVEMKMNDIQKEDNVVKIYDREGVVRYKCYN